MPHFKTVLPCLSWIVYMFVSIALLSPKIMPSSHGADAQNNRFDYPRYVLHFRAHL